jgi:hypothetical protein
MTQHENDRLTALFDESGTTRRDVIARSALFAASGAAGLLSFQSAAFAQTGDQPNWRFCNKCNAMFFDGYADNKGHCPAGGAHVAQGFRFLMHYDAGKGDGARRQYDWRFCGKCSAMFFDGDANKGHCAGGGAHNAAGWVFGLVHASATGAQQDQWRFCNKCEVLFYDGYPAKGSCAAGGGHVAQGFVFYIDYEKPDDARSQDVVRLRQNITTPSGTAMGGWAELELHSDGTYFFRGHIHDSGAEGYKFHIRAALTSKSGLALVAAKSGDVEGSSSVFNVRRDFNWNDQGKSDLVRDEWADVKSGTLQVAKAYQGGITGSLQAIATDLLSFVVTDLAFGPQAAIIMFLGNEATAVTGSGKIGGLVVAGGLAWMISPTYAIPVFVAEKVATDALIKSRTISAEEYNFAKIVFGDTLPPAGKINLTNIGGKDNRAFVFRTPDGTIQMNLTDRVYTATGGPMRAMGPIAKDGTTSYPVPGELFIHELTHAWQLHNRQMNMYHWVFEGAQHVSYTPLGADRPWTANDIEKQAAIVNLWFEKYAKAWTDQADLKKKLETAAALQDPYFKFIKDNIRLGKN